MSENIGFIGLGEMGMAMSKRLQDEGYQVIANDTAQEALDEAEEYGMKVVQTAKEVVENAANIFVIVATPDQVNDVLFGEESVTQSDAEELTIIAASTLEPAFMNKLEEQLTAEGHHLIESPVSGGEIGAEEGSLTVMTAGEKEAVERMKPYLKVVGEDLLYFGEEYGAAQKAKLTNNLLLGIHIIAMAEAMQFGEKSDLPKEELLKLLNVSTGQSWVTENWDEVSSWASDDTLGVLRDDLIAVVKENEQYDTTMPYGALSTQLLYESMAAVKEIQNKK